MENEGMEVAAVRARISQIEAQILPLIGKWKAAADYLHSITGESVACGEISALAVSLEAPRPPALPAAANEERAYRSRQFNQRAVDEAVAIIERHGRPMSAPEIHQEHSKRDEIATEVLYRLLYNRVLSGSLMSLNGAIWIEGKELPPGSWNLATAKRSKKLGGDAQESGPK